MAQPRPEEAEVRRVRTRNKDADISPCDSSGVISVGEEKEKRKEEEMSEKYIALSDLMKFPIRRDHYDKEHGNENFVYGIETVLEYAEYLPVIEIVRCKDCKHATFYNCKNDACYRGIICEYQIAIGDENFYCSYGKRRETDG